MSDKAVADSSASKNNRNPKSKITGIWQGALEVSGTKLRIVFNIAEDENGDLSATMDSPDQRATDIPVHKVWFKNDSVHIEVRAVGGHYKGVLQNDRTKISGQWYQGGARLDVELKSVEKKPVLNRPQEPKKPYPYRDEEVFYQNEAAGVEIAGTLTSPRTKGPFTAVILISGSGPQDRDETVMGHRPFLVLADRLTKQGIAVLRTDDRGVGGTTGNLYQSTSQDLAGDVLAGIEFLKNRSDINNKKIGLIGHSEGGLIAPMVAAQSSDVAFIVLMAGPGLPGEEILYLQNELIRKAEGQTEKQIKENHQIQKRIFKTIKSHETAMNKKARLRNLFTEVFEYLYQLQKKEIGNKEKFIQSKVNNVLSPWFQFFLNYDPRRTLKKVKCPVLALNGQKDLQVTAEQNLEAIQKALKEGGNTQVTTKLFPNLNHLFQKAESGAPSEYAKIEQTLSPEVIAAIAEWIEKQMH
ncbi:MAG: alpha/beta fold hydrolase [Caldithrix sp.]|nr:alpha/beta fold hydrolase [Caldithrix sp.]